MAVSAKRNTNYGGDVVTQKYSPLENPTYKADDIAEYSAVLTNRLAQLESANVFPQPLLICTDWDSIPAEKSEPPLVVISSNRSKWIAAGVKMSTEQFKISEYEGSNDLNALTGLVAKQTQSPPLYVPKRSDGNRKIYIVVHLHEYHQYVEALGGSDMTVVGWTFKTRTATGPLSGFGASRYAAIEFCKYLRDKIDGATWDYAWLLDDNVVGITNFPGYGTVERAMRAATPEPICSAFQGCSGITGFSGVTGWASTEVNAYPSRAKPTVLAPPDVPTPKKPLGIVQQAVLWNIKLMSEKKLNFAPLFVASGEDVSLTNYFQANAAEKTRKAPLPPIPAKPPIPYLFYGGLTVTKEEVKYNDDSHGAKLVNKARDDYQKWFAAEEAKATPEEGTAPPPVNVESGDTAVPGLQSLSDFITKWFTSTVPKVKPTAVAAGDPKVQDKAKCQGAEQIACGAIGSNCVDPEALYRTFIIPGADGQVIQRMPTPRKRS